MEWQLRIVILEQIHEFRWQLTCEFLRKSILGMQENEWEAHTSWQQWILETWFAEFNRQDETIQSFKCNHDNKYLLKFIKNTLNSIWGDKKHQNVDWAIAALKL